MWHPQVLDFLIYLLFLSLFCCGPDCVFASVSQISCLDLSADTDGWGYVKNTQMVFENMSHISVAVVQYGAAFTINVTVKEASQCQAKQVFKKHFFFPLKLFCLVLSLE